MTAAATEIAFLNAAGAMNAADFAFAVEAIRIQLTRDLLPAWAGYLPVPRALTVTGYTSATDLVPGSFDPIEVLASLDDPSILGDHSGLAATGQAWGRSLPRSTVMSHEGVELVVDPYADRWVKLPDGRVVALESADPVENDSYTISVTIGDETRDVPVSNFVYPDWFGEGPGTQYDHMGLCKAADENRGYLVVENPDGSTSNVFADGATDEYKARVNAKLETVGRRTARRFNAKRARHYMTTLRNAA